MNTGRSKQRCYLLRTKCSGCIFKNIVMHGDHAHGLQRDLFEVQIAVKRQIIFDIAQQPSHQQRLHMIGALNSECLARDGHHCNQRRCIAHHMPLAQILDGAFGCG